ncbi:hypothetical protein LCM4579_16125 [Ensifer sp. LCM 4579]|nr:hypothetical protein LCM4579_16125 [Ensifer sp. LCM 4579]
MHRIAGRHVGDDSARPLTADALLQNPRFLGVLQTSARALIAVNDLFPRIARLVSSHRKWMLTHAAYALHLERDPNDPETGITAARLQKFIHQTGGASRNTAAAFLAELVTYKLLQPVAGGRSRRTRPLEPAGASENAMRLWFKSQMSALDLLDGGSRAIEAEADASIFERAQPLAVKRLLSDPNWTEPPEGVAVFAWAESGGVILDDLMGRPATLTPPSDKVWIEVNLPSLADHYLVSNTHVRRLFARAEAAGLIGKAQDGRRGRFWLSARLIEEYAYWQAIKLEALASAFDQVTASRS